MIRDQRKRRGGQLGGGEKAAGLKPGTHKGRKENQMQKHPDRVGVDAVRRGQQEKEMGRRRVRDRGAVGEGVGETWYLRIINLFYSLLTRSFERGARIRMRLAEVERLEGVGGEVIGLLRLWKCVEKCEKKGGSK